MFEYLAGFERGVLECVFVCVRACASCVAVSVSVKQ